MTVFPPLYALNQGLRASLLPAINLAQISEFSLVLIQSRHWGRTQVSR
jgi:predicted Kef-type K+ transport protein